ncbi:Protein CBG05171 [Caenorhabditis briggsae]|uniref:Protein CBG05171 n=1 Tax=Caenorhabditis briggsae TaxID=6238 RepID=A8WZA7_CAEBR|nr:Protein CBG05171 [Caenorhabditis briggsae]CAP25717.2 Protein CBG05171 [Caenorhabditis briggsae]
MYLKYRELKSYFRQANISALYIKASRTNLLIGLAALTAYQLAINFPATKINHVALVGNKVALVLANIYIWCHAFLSLKIQDANIPRWILFLIRICLAFVVFSLAAAMIQANWVPDPAKQYVAIDAIYEWCCYFAFSIFLLTDSYEFRFMVFKPPKLIIRGCTGYNERVFESSDVSEDEDILPPFSQIFGIAVLKNENFLLPTRLISSTKDLEEDLSDVSLEEGIVEEEDIDELIKIELELIKRDEPEKQRHQQKSTTLGALDHLADGLGYDIDGRDRPDDALFESINEAAAFSPLIFCGESHEMECIALWDYFGGNGYDDLNVHAGDLINVVAEEYQVRVIDQNTYMRLPFQWSLGRWMTERNVNPYLGLIPSHYIVSKQFYDEHPLLFQWPVWYHGSAEVHEVVHKLYSDRSALCPGLFGIFSPAWLNIDLDEHRCYFLVILIERDKKHDDELKQLIEIERGNYGIMVNAINHFFGEMIPENSQPEKSAKVQYIEFMSEIETTPFEPAVVPIHRSSLGHYELMGERYETLYDLVHHLSTHRSALPHKLVYCRSSPLVVGQNVVPPPTLRFRKDLRCQPMITEQWAATHFDEVTRRFEGSEKTLFATKTLFDVGKPSHKVIEGQLSLRESEKDIMASYLAKLDIPRSPSEDKVSAAKKKYPPHETSIRINSPFYIDLKQIESARDSLGKGAFGQVNKGKLIRNSGEKVPVAVKKLQLRENEKDERNPAFTEMEILEMVSHPNIVTYYGFSMMCSGMNGVSGGIQLFLIFELMDASLDKFIEKTDAMLSENERLDILAQICRGMSFLHTRTPPVVHGDLAARNVLIKKHPVYTKKHICKITDLGLAKTCLDELHTDYDDQQKVPFKWLPPEVLSTRTLSLQTDIWAFGITCFEVCSKMGEPYGCIQASNLYQYLNDGYRHDILKDMSATIYDIALDCMRHYPSDRPCFEELVDRFLDHMIETEGEDDVKRKEREKITAEKNRKERMRKNHDKLHQ